MPNRDERNVAYRDFRRFAKMFISERVRTSSDAEDSNNC
jgi:hypothetical protein